MSGEKTYRKTRPNMKRERERERERERCKGSVCISKIGTVSSVELERW